VEVEVEVLDQVLQIQWYTVFREVLVVVEAHSEQVDLHREVQVILLQQVLLKVILEPIKIQLLPINPQELVEVEQVQQVQLTTLLVKQEVEQVDQV
tara:strand:+ start:107 stop:394 length:288 start_codon:yes stop_codon:yes gene_type:complete